MNWLIDQMVKEWAAIKEAPLSFIVACVLALIFAYFLVEWLRRDALSRKDDLIADLQKKLGLQPSQQANPGGESPKAECSDKWLHDIAEQDRHDISKSVRVVSQSAENWDLRPEQAHIFFSIVVFNGSVFNIAVDRNIGGHISYGNDSDGYRRLSGDRMIVGRCRVSECPRYYYLRIEIQQWLTQDDLAAIAKGDQSGRFNFQLKDLVINVIGGPGASGVRPSPLSFHSFESVRFPK